MAIQLQFWPSVNVRITEQIRLAFLTKKQQIAIWIYFFQANSLTVIKLVKLLVELSEPEKKELEEAEKRLKVISNDEIKGQVFMFDQYPDLKSEEENA